MDVDELELIDWLTRRQPERPNIPLGIGDDMAIVRSPDDTILLSTDMLLDGVHFDRANDTPSDIGRKAVACGLSDCAAMAVRPVALTVSVALPRSMTRDDVYAMFRGALRMAEAYDVTIVGGDTTRWDQPLVIDVSATALPYAGIKPVTRSGGRAGDLLYVTGHLGGSLLGHHLRFEPRVREAYSLAEHLGMRLHAMIDVTDGLALDAWRLSQASGVGAVLDQTSIDSIVSESARRAADRDGRSAFDHALHDGEDFELLLAVSDKVTASPVELHAVGEFTSTGFMLRRKDGDLGPLEPKGYVH